MDLMTTDADRRPGPDDRRLGFNARPGFNARLSFNARLGRELAYLLSNLPLGVIGFVVTVTLLALGIGTAVTFVGIGCC
jgi:hypothetical protein